MQGHGKQGFPIHDVMNNPRNCERLIGWEGIGVRSIGVQLEMNSMKSLFVCNKIDMSIKQFWLSCETGHREIQLFCDFGQ